MKEFLIILCAGINAIALIGWIIVLTYHYTMRHIEKQEKEDAKNELHSGKD